VVGLGTQSTRRRTYIDAFVREAGRDGGAFFFGVAKEDRELLDCGHGDVSAVVAGQKGLSPS
jgi:hypothetical protein